ncbi:MAG: glycosyltransferase family 2 protein, partial [Omnitrophica WOR_2 bacterium]
VSNWKALEAITRQLGPRFRYLHLEQWPGFKSGALNFALAETAPDAEIVATIDSDYQLDPAFLQDLVPAFADPRMAFVQTPQDYRDTALNTYTRATYYGYKYFFDVSMPSRNEHNAIIFAGTMGLIRKSVLQEIGGWDEWCITEDAEASLRILKRGYQSLFINKTYGKGLMPFTFDGLKKQRFRWCFGGIQILKKHWEALMPWARWVDPQNHLSPAQRYYYLVGGLQWYTDLFNLMFALFLSLGALFSVYQTHFVIRPLTGPLMIMPAIFLFMHLWRFLWVLRHKLHLSWKLALQTMYNFFSMGWAVTLASIQGAIQPKGVFLRTPKTASKSKLFRAFQAAQWETGIGLAALAAGIGALVYHPSLQTAFLGGLLGWQASLYLAAPAFSLMSAGAPAAQAPVVVPAGRSVRESRAGALAIALALILLAVGAIAQFAPPPPKPPSYSQLRPPEVPLQRLFGFNNLPPEQRILPPDTETPTPTATSTPAATSPGPTATPTLTPQPSSTTEPTSTALPTSTETPTALPSATETPPPTPTDTPAPAATETPTDTPAPSPTDTSLPPTETLTPTP